MTDRPVRVGLLTYGLDRPLSGVSRVALELGRALLADPGCQVTVLAPYRRGALVGEPGVRSVYLPGCRLLPGLMALGGPMLALAARALILDVVHDPIGVSPFTLGRWAGRDKRVVTIHDAIAFEYPAGYPLLNNVLHRVYVPMTLRNVDAVATDSAHAQRGLSHYLGLDPARVPVIPLGTSDVFGPVDPARVAEMTARHGLDGPYILYVGAFKRHKNLLGLLEAFARRAGAPARLPAGAGRPNPVAVRRARRAHQRAQPGGIGQRPRLRAGSGFAGTVRRCATVRPAVAPRGLRDTGPGGDGLWDTGRVLDGKLPARGGRRRRAADRPGRP